jgi:hypothetical protein
MKPVPRLLTWHWQDFSNILLETGILNEALARAKQVCAAIRKADLRLSARDVAVHFADALREVKAECNYDNDREECRARFGELVGQVNARADTSRVTREQALYHLLPRPPRKNVRDPLKSELCIIPENVKPDAL